MSGNYSRFIGSTSFRKSDSYKLLKLVKSGRYLSKEALRDKLFPNAVNKNSRFIQLYNRTVSILASNIFLKPTEDNAEYKAVYLDCIKKVAVVKTLAAEFKLEASSYIAQQTLAKAKKYQLTEFCRTLSYELMLTAQARGDKHHADCYKRDYGEYDRTEQGERKAMVALYEVALLSSNQKRPKGPALEEIMDKLDEVIRLESRSYLIHFRKFRARLIKASLLNDHARIYGILKEALIYFDSLNFSPPKGHLYMVFHKISPSLIITRRYDEARSNIERCLAIPSVGNHNWHISLQHQAILGFHSKNYELARMAIHLARQNSNSVANYINEWWKLAEAYLYFASLNGLVEFDGSFRPARFLNEVPASSKDKNGANVSILVIGQFLIQLAKGNRDPFFDKSESMRVYIHNYLKDESSQRCRIFINMLRQLPNCDFNETRFVEATAEDFARLQSTPARIEDLETEIIPYEELYGLLCGMADRIQLSRT